MQTKVQYRTLLPVLLAFFVMSFVDLVGIGVDRVKDDFNLSDSLAQLIPSAAFLWFFVLSVPVGILQARWGKRTMLISGIGVTAAGLLFPFFSYSFVNVLSGFALLGIGNTIVQVSANPLLVDVVPGNRAPSFLSFSQFIKAIGSMAAAPLAAWLAIRWGDWKLLFLVFGAVSVISALWLATIKVDESGKKQSSAGFASAFGLLSNTYVLLMVLVIFLVVGIDVGFNAFSGQFLTRHTGMDAIRAESGRSVYFFGRMVGTFFGALLLTRIASRGFLLASSLGSLVVLLALLFNTSVTLAWGLVFVTGLAVANIFPLAFSITVARYPERSSEISGLMMMAIAGGAIVPPVMGYISDTTGSVVFAMAVLLPCAIYLVGASWYALKR
jgi:fucose permease